MSSRYRVARALGQKAFEEAVREDELLLQEFGLRLLSVDGGLRAAVEAELKGERIHPWNVFGVEDKTWRWLRPLLLELRDARSLPHAISLDPMSLSSAPAAAK